MLQLIFISLFVCSFSLPINDDLMSQPDFFEGDIAGINIESSEDLKGLSQIVTNSRGLWPNGIVPYIIDNVYSSAQLSNIKVGMQQIESQTRLNGKDCIKFVPRNNQATWIRIINGEGCWSYIGKQQASGEQQVSIQANGCTHKITVAHELLHALGFWHEQSRIDRDNYVTVNLNNVQDGQQHNFNKYNTNQASTLGFNYDYYSIMHYDSRAFSKNGQNTIVPKQNGINLVHTSQKSSLTNTDVQEIRKYYGCT